ncbi:MAG TPA: response regulator [Methylococcaceae bacterium]|nr:response regulator [Methylococcaceae bacterium]
MITILLVDDSDSFRFYFAEFLRTYFPHLAVSEAHDAGTTFAAIRETWPEFIFMDINLGEENGLELTRAIKKIYLPFVCVLTSYDLPEYREAARRCGADYFLPKDTISREQLSALIEPLLAASTPSA